MIELERDGDVFVMTMTAGENRWNTTFVRAIAAALDEVEASDGPAALVTMSDDPKFFSNGLDLAWVHRLPMWPPRPGPLRRVGVAGLPPRHRRRPTRADRHPS